MEEELNLIEDKIKNAEKNEGDIEIRDALVSKAQYFLKYNKPKEEIIEVQETAINKSDGSGRKMDLVFELEKYALEKNDLDFAKKNLDRLNKLDEEAKDWERKNKVTIYSGIQNILIRDFKSAAELFLKGIATFKTHEILNYNEFIYYTVLTSLVSLDRNTIKSKIVKSPEILSTVNEIPLIKQLINSYYRCDQSNFLITFVDICEQLKNDKLLAIHHKYQIRQMRIVIYRQFLDPYKTVTLGSMANLFGVSVEFIDKELSEFISSGKLNCRIDRVNGIIESNRVDNKDEIYAEIIKNGDVLLSNIQKLKRQIDI